MKLDKIIAFANRLETITKSAETSVRIDTLKGIYIEVWMYKGENRLAWKHGISFLQLDRMLPETFDAILERSYEEIKQYYDVCSLKRETST